LASPLGLQGISREDPVAGGAALGEPFDLLLEVLVAFAVVDSRVVLGLMGSFWGTAWTATAWCELRVDFRNFRLDRVREIRSMDDRFADEDGRTLKDMLAQYGPGAVRLLEG
jgi:hypothetical protein